MGKYNNAANLNFYEEHEQVEIELWNQAMDDMDSNEQNTEMYIKAYEIAKIIDNYNKLLHQAMKDKFGEGYYEKLTI